MPADGQVSAEVYILISALLFAIGMAGFCLRRNVLVMLMSVELMFASSGLVFVAVGRDRADPNGQVYALLLIALAAAEVAVGLALVVAVFRNRRSVDVDLLSELKG
jgi:NADH-quinone oxidoreductase subunit K